MRVDELAEELADFWLSAVSGASWEQRRKILAEVLSQLRSDIERASDFDALSPRFVSALISRLGDPAVASRAQAEVYANSFNARHREAAEAWFRQERGRQESPAGERRRFQRETIDAVSEIWIGGASTSCRVLDVSPGGARVMARDAEPAPGTVVRVALPNLGVREATVVFRGSVGIGLSFSDQPAAG